MCLEALETEIEITEPPADPLNTAELKAYIRRREIQDETFCNQDPQTPADHQQFDLRLLKEFEYWTKAETKWSAQEDALTKPSFVIKRSAQVRDGVTIIGVGATILDLALLGGAWTVISTSATFLGGAASGLNRWFGRKPEQDVNQFIENLERATKRSVIAVHSIGQRFLRLWHREQKIN